MVAACASSEHACGGLGVEGCVVYGTCAPHCATADVTLAPAAPPPRSLVPLRAPLCCCVLCRTPSGMSPSSRPTRRPASTGEALLALALALEPGEGPSRPERAMRPAVLRAPASRCPNSLAVRAAVWRRRRLAEAGRRRARGVTGGGLSAALRSLSWVLVLIHSNVRLSFVSRWGVPMAAQVVRLLC